MLQSLLPIILILVVLAILVFVVRVMRSSGGRASDACPYVRAELFSAAERSFLGVLEQAVGRQFRIMGKVRLADIIGVKSGLAARARQAARNRIQSKHVDFVLCNPATFSVAVVVELDDQSHKRSKRRERDAFVDRTLEAAGISIVHFSAKRQYSVQEVRAALVGSQPAPGRPVTSNVGTAK